MCCNHLSYSHIAVTCDHLPIQTKLNNVNVVTRSQNSPLTEGQFITYTCEPGFILTGPNASVCTENGEWEPNPGEVDCIGMLQLQYSTQLSHNFITNSIFIMQLIVEYHS